MTNMTNIAAHRAKSVEDMFQGQKFVVIAKARDMAYLLLLGDSNVANNIMITLLYMMSSSG